MCNLTFFLNFSQSVLEEYAGPNVNLDLLYHFRESAEEENAPAPNAENAENENPVDAQNMLKPIKLENGKFKCPYCPYETKQKQHVNRHIKTKHFGNIFLLLLRLLFFTLLQNVNKLFWSKLQE